MTKIKDGETSSLRGWNDDEFWDGFILISYSIHFLALPLMNSSRLRKLS